MMLFKVLDNIRHPDIRMTTTPAQTHIMHLQEHLTEEEHISHPDAINDQMNQSLCSVVSDGICRNACISSKEVGADNFVVQVAFTLFVVYGIAALLWQALSFVTKARTYLILASLSFLVGSLGALWATFVNQVAAISNLKLH